MFCLLPYVSFVEIEPLPIRCCTLYCHHYFCTHCFRSVENWPCAKAITFHCEFWLILVLFICLL